MEETLENLKVGDKVFYDGRGVIGIKTISRITKTQIITKNGEKFRKQSGVLVGGDVWSRVLIRIVTPGRIERIAIRKLKNEVLDLRNNLSTPQDKETLIKLIAALKPFVEGK